MVGYRLHQQDQPSGQSSPWEPLSLLHLLLLQQHYWYHSAFSQLYLKLCCQGPCCQACLGASQSLYESWSHSLALLVCHPLGRGA